VAVKVFRPGVDKQIEVDLDILLELAALAEKRTEWGAHYGAMSLAQEFAATLRNEQNYEQEGHNIDRLRQMFATEEYVHVPFVYWETTTRRVLTMERIVGIKITDVGALDAAGLDRAILLKAVLQDGFFHADPHAGNFIILPHEVIGMVDFGIMGHLDHAQRLGLVQLFVGLFRQETDRVVEALSDLGIATRAADQRKLARDLDRLRLRYYGLDMERIRVRSFIEDLMGLILANRLKMPSDLVLVFKTIAMLEGISVQLDPDINVFAEVEPYVRDALLELESPINQAKVLAGQMRDSAEALLLLPQQIQRMLEQVEVGDTNLSMNLKGLDEPTRRLTAAANRLVLAILAAAFVIGPALLIPHTRDLLPDWQTSAILLILAGFASSMLLTVALLLAIWRSGR